MRRPIGFGDFCDRYLPDRFTKWGADQRSTARAIEQAVREHRHCLCIMGRGRGATSLGMAAIAWARTEGFARGACLITSDGRNAKELLHQIYDMLSTVTARRRHRKRTALPTAIRRSIQAWGVLEGFKGRHFVEADGTRRRPTLIVLDNPLAGEVLKSPSMKARVEHALKQVPALGPVGCPVSIIHLQTAVDREMKSTFGG